ncbi:MAG TPA: hypothetical protein DEA08_16455 [Planctomycetes bacterium]|nr:hypothetical protein [Planctomycetota bacterium]
MTESLLTLLVALPLVGGSCAYGVERGGRAAGVGLALLTFLLATWGVGRFLSPATPDLERGLPALLANRIATVIGGAGSAPLPVEREGELRWAAPPERAVQERFLAHLQRGGDPGARAALLDDLSGVAVCAEDLRALEAELGEVAAVNSGARAILDDAALARERSARERRRLELALLRLEGETRDLRRAARGPLATRFKLIELRSWMPSLRVHWLLGVDGLALGLIWVVSLIGLACSFTALARERSLMSWILLTQAGLTLTFAALDAVLLVTGWTLLLVPTYALIGGGPESPGAQIAKRAVLPAFLGALVLLAALLTLSVLHAQGSTNLLVLIEVAGGTSLKTQAVLFGGLLLACAVRMPLPPLHGWLPAAQTELPVPFAAFLQGAVLSLGGFGLLRLAWPMAPQIVGDPRVASAIAGAALLGLLFAGLAAIASRDLRRTLALTSVAHASLVVFGLALATPASLAGSALELVAHGVGMSAACLALGGLIERTRDAEIGAMGGLIEPLPRLGAVAGLACLSLVGLPGLVGFVSRFLIIAGGWGSTLVPRWLVVAGALTLGLLGLGLWWTYQRVFLGERHASDRFGDLSALESASQLPLVGACLVLGVAPPLLLELLVQGSEGLAILLSGH